MYSGRFLIVIMLISPVSPVLAQRQYPELIDTTWSVSSDKFRHVVKKLQTDVKPPARTSISPGGMFRCAWNKPLKLPVSGIKPKDTLEVIVSNSSGHPFKSATILDDKNKQLTGVVNAASVTLKLVVQNENLLTLKLETRPARKKQFASISVSRITPVPPSFFYNVSDTLFALTRPVVRDTLLVSLLDDTLSLPPVWNIDAQPASFKQCLVPVSVKPDAHLSHIAYWIGIGRNCLDNYTKMEADMPPPGNGPGVSPPIAAFTMGQFTVLPDTPSHDVDWFFSGDSAHNKPSGNNTLFPECKRSQSCTLRFRRAEKSKLGTSLVPVSKEQLRFVVNFRNRNTVIGYPVRIIVAGCFIRETQGEMTKSVLQTKSFKEEAGQ